MPRAEDFVDGFRAFWAAPSLDGFARLLRADVLLRQPLAPPMRGLDEVRAVFGRIFAWLPDLRGEVDRWTGTDDVVFIEFRLSATIGGRRVEWPVVDCFVLDERGLARERASYFDALPLLAAAATRPSSWWRLWRSGAAATLLGWPAPRSRT